MKFLIRTDASEKIGFGHLIRTLVLADTLSTEKHQCYFYLYGDNTAIELIKSHGHIVLDKKPELDDETEKSIYETFFNKYDWFIIDSYKIGTSLFQFLNYNAIKTLVIDDVADRKIYADIILNQNLNADTLSYKLGNNAKLLLGSKYILLRSEFLNVIPKPISDQVNRILITLGGSDPNNVTLKVLQFISDFIFKNIIFDVVISPDYRYRNDLLKYSDKMNITILQNIKDMWNVINNADIVINGGGSTNYEVAYLGKPNIIIVVADNQLGVAKGLHERGISFNLGWYNKFNKDDLFDKLSLLINDKIVRDRMSKLSRELVDGKGSKRVIETIMSKV